MVRAAGVTSTNVQILRQVMDLQSLVGFSVAPRLGIGQLKRVVCRRCFQRLKRRVVEHLVLRSVVQLFDLELVKERSGVLVSAFLGCFVD